MGRKRKQQQGVPEDTWTSGTWSANSGTTNPGPPYTGTTNTWTAESSTTSINPWLVVGFATLVFVVAVAALVVVFTSKGSERELVVDTSTTSTTTAPSTTTTAPPPSVPATIATTIPPPTSPPVTVTAPTTTVPTISEADALYQLQDKLDQDSGTAEQLVDMWVPQVSSKKIGLDAPGDDRGPYTAAMVLSDHLAYEERYEPEGADVLALRSDDFNFKESGWVVTVVARTFLTPEEANGWCEDHDIGVDDCFAKRLAHDGDWKGSVKGRK